MFVLGYDDFYFITTVSEILRSQGRISALLKNKVKKPVSVERNSSFLLLQKIFESGIEFNITKYVESVSKLYLISESVG